MSLGPHLSRTLVQPCLLVQYCSVFQATSTGMFLHHWQPFNSLLALSVCVYVGPGLISPVPTNPCVGSHSTGRLGTPLSMSTCPGLAVSSGLSSARWVSLNFVVAVRKEFCIPWNTGRRRRALRVSPMRKDFPTECTSWLSSVDMKSLLLLSGSCLLGLRVCSITIIIPNNRDHRTMVFKHFLIYFKLSHLNYKCSIWFMIFSLIY